MMASCFVDDTGVALESFSMSLQTGSSRHRLVLHFRSIDPGAMASTRLWPVLVPSTRCALIHRTLILFFQTLIQQIFSCALIIVDNSQNNYFSHVR